MSVYIKSYAQPEIDESEILRYSGSSVATEEIRALMNECLELCLDCISYNVCYTVLPITNDGKHLDLGFASTSSKDLSKNLNGCSSIVLFAATLGNSLDRLIARYSALAPSKAFMLQAIGAERIEALCNAFDREIATEYERQGKLTRPRFSAGYGDFPLEFQKDICRVLDVQRKIGITLQESLVMLPTKSVTAIIGIKDQET